MDHHTANASFPKEGTPFVRVALPEAEGVILWFFSLTQAQSAYPCFAQCLPDDDLRAALINPAAAPPARVQKALSRAMLRFALAEEAKVAPVGLRFSFDGNDRPILTETPETLRDFNLSHSGDLLMVGVLHRHSAFARIGVDVELAAIPRAIHSLRHRELTDHENATFNALTESQIKARFLSYWALKEAFAKAHGAGFSKLGGFKKMAFDLPATLFAVFPRPSVLPEGESPSNWLFSLPKLPDTLQKKCYAAVALRADQSGMRESARKPTETKYPKSQRGAQKLKTAIKSCG